MPPEIESGGQPSVRFSRVLGLHSVVALGASISVGLGVYVLLGLFVQVAGRQTVGAPYLFMAVLAAIAFGAALLCVLGLGLLGVVQLPGVALAESAKQYRHIQVGEEDFNGYG